MIETKAPGVGPGASDVIWEIEDSIPAETVARPYSHAAFDYYKAGWINPLPASGKSPAVTDHHGRNAPNVGWSTLEGWIQTHGQKNIYLRSQSSWMAIDVDAANGKDGAETFAKAQTELGELPPTITNTARGSGQPSRHYIFRVPAGTDFSGAEGRLKNKFGKNVDIVWSDNRGIVVWPSVHPDTGAVYRWYGLDGQLLARIPSLTEAAELPPEWLDFLAQPETPVESTSSLNGTYNGPNPFLDPSKGTGVSAGRPEVWQQIMAKRDELMGAQNGEGNNVANKMCFEVGQYLPDSGISVEEATTVMLTAIDGWEWSGASKSSVVRTMRDAVADGVNNPRTWEASRKAATDPFMNPDGTADSAKNPQQEIDGWTAEILKRAVELDLRDAVIEYRTTGEIPPRPVPQKKERRSRTVDLTPFINQSYMPLEPRVGARRQGDHRKLLYPGLWHTVIALTTAGKSWFSLWHAATVLREGGTVVYCHFEETAPAGMIARLRSIDPGVVKPETMERFLWLDCGMPWGTGEFERALPETPTLVILDGINAACGQHGWDPNLASSVGAYRSRFVNPATEKGAPVLSLGHPPKAKDRQDERHGYGATGWLDEVSGASFRLEASKKAPIRRDYKGCSALYSTKDRYGQVEAHGVHQPEREGAWYYQGAFTLDDSPEQHEKAGNASLYLTSAVRDEDDSKPDALDQLCTAIVGYLGENGGGFKSAKELRDGLRSRKVPFGNDDLGPALIALNRTGVLEWPEGASARAARPGWLTTPAEGAVDDHEAA